VKSSLIAKCLTPFRFAGSLFPAGSMIGKTRGIYIRSSIYLYPKTLYHIA
jgi:hypothetical protein